MKWSSAFGAQKSMNCRYCCTKEVNNDSHLHPYFLKETCTNIIAWSCRCCCCTKEVSSDSSKRRNKTPFTSCSECKTLVTLTHPPLLSPLRPYFLKETVGIFVWAVVWFAKQQQGVIQHLEKKMPYCASQKSFQYTTSSAPFKKIAGLDIVIVKWQELPRVRGNPLNGTQYELEFLFLKGEVEL